MIELAFTLTTIKTTKIFKFQKLTQDNKKIYRIKKFLFIS